MRMKPGFIPLATNIYPIIEVPGNKHKKTPRNFREVN